MTRGDLVSPPVAGRMRARASEEAADTPLGKDDKNCKDAPLGATKLRLFRHSGYSTSPRCSTQVPGMMLVWLEYIWCYKGIMNQTRYYPNQTSMVRLSFGLLTLVHEWKYRGMLLFLKQLNNAIYARARDTVYMPSSSSGVHITMVMGVEIKCTHHMSRSDGQRPVGNCVSRLRTEVINGFVFFYWLFCTMQKLTT